MLHDAGTTINQHWFTILCCWGANMLQPSTYFWHETLPSASNSMRKWLDLFHKNVQLPTKNALAMHSGSFAEFWTEFWLGVFDSLDKDLQWSLSAVKMFKMFQNKSNKSKLILGSSILISLRNICIFVFNGINSLWQMFTTKGRINVSLHRHR